MNEGHACRPFDMILSFFCYDDKDGDRGLTTKRQLHTKKLVVLVSYSHHIIH